MRTLVERERGSGLPKLSLTGRHATAEAAASPQQSLRLVATSKRDECRPGPRRTRQLQNCTLVVFSPLA
ncbi:hypothetical protein EVAR_10036_1 [Eumeta japonica]|uniref:Uncharacterized protein n=1 Tax=Eumeta variegata TaxID=151549 RepID=A0A4C1TR48_EUMVA|nr:hypothetical protein EVAR_10036_1 [Eumeta japonica]